MANLIRHGQASIENWPLLDAAALEAHLAQGAGEGAADESISGILIPLELWLAEPDRCMRLRTPFGVQLRGDDEPQRIAADLHRIALIAVQFARFSDGRGLSIARLLRERYGFKGELRAVGDVLRDQIFYMQRVGFDAFELRGDQDVAAALTAFRDFSEAYQAAVDRPLPLFRRRAA